VVGAVTFDLWDTLVVDDSDEAVRRASGLPSKVEARSRAFVAEVRAWHDVAEERARAALDAANEAFRHAWKVEHRTPHVADRLRDALARLDLAPTPGFDALVEAFASMEVVHPPRPCEGVVEALEALAGRCRLGIVSDAIVTPGSHLRRILEGHGLLRFFHAFVFSDEAGASKPSPRVFELAAEGLGVSPAALIHVGDREANDVAGPHGVGARAILYTGAVDRGADRTRADAVARHLGEVPGIVDRLLSVPR
jgi:putative hydrolase of the HAD superfamily